MKSLNKSRNVAKRKAFALVLAIGAMAFMVLLTLTLSSIISSKLRVLNAQKQTREARQNAVLGMSIAISNLQRTVGKDNAITIQSSIFDQDPETVKIDNVSMPYVIGTINVKKDTSELSPKDLQEEQLDLIENIKNGGTSTDVSWLVSGEIKNPISDLPENLAEETVTLAEYKLLTEYPVEYGGKISASDKTENVEVKAGKVRFNADQGQSSEGAYAWWVSDESQKAKISLSRPDMYLDKEMPDVSNTSMSGQAPADPRVPQVINTSFIKELADLKLSPFVEGYNEENARNVAKISTLDELPIVNSDLTQWAKDNKGDYTAVSVGLPVDVTQGRLKEDLSVYLYTGKGLDDNDPIIRGSGVASDKEYTGVNFGLRNYKEHLPTFGLLRSFANVALDKSTFQSGVNPQAQVINSSGGNITHGVYPIVESAEWMLFPAYTINTTNRDATFSLDNTKLGSFKLNLNYIMYLRVVLRNPFNVTINQSNYILRIGAPVSANLSNNDGQPELRTRWVYHFYNKSKGAMDEKYINVVFKSNRTNTNRKPNFADFLEDYMDNNMPTMNFNLQGIRLLPGESVELCQPKIAQDQNEFSTAKVQNLSASKNVLRPGKIQVSEGHSDVWAALPQKCFKISTDINFTFSSSKSDIPEDIASFAYNNEKRIYTRTVMVDGKSYEERIVPLIYDKFQTNNADVDIGSPNSSGAKTDAFDGWPIFEFEPNSSDGYTSPYKFSLSDLTKNGKGRSYIRNSLELLSANKKRLWKHDLTEWDSRSGSNPSTYNGTGGRDRTHNFYRQDDNQMQAWPYGKKYLEGKSNFIGIVQNATKFFDRSLQFGVDGGKYIPLFYKKDDCRIDKNNLLDSSQILFTIRLPNWHAAFNGILSHYNYRATQLVDDDYLKDSSVIRRSTTNATVGMQDCGSASRNASFFFGKKADQYSTGYHTWANTSANIDGLKTSQNKTLPGNYPPGTYGIFSPISGTKRHDYDGLIFAPFDLPRKETDLMSLAHFRHAHLSIMPWQPSYPFAESYASPFIRRQNVVEFEKGDESHVNTNYSTGDYIYSNEMIDISYLLNASMWDRFFLSTIPQTNESFTPMAGMRMPNTRIFLTSVPEDPKNLKNSEVAFEEAASHVGIDGAFNVNSTSYEAWRSVLGGLLGTKRDTLTNGTINQGGDDSENSDKFKMPNPGDLNPLTVPEEGKYFSYIDLSVGRKISESEIDMLAREIVAEVKRRAPFFSLSDFVNRKLETFEDDLDSNYRSMMGTIATAIRRSEHLEDRPNNFFNDSSMEENYEQVLPKGDIHKVPAICAPAEYISCYDNRNGTANQVGSQQGNARDIGEQVREARQEFLDAALQVPHKEYKAHAWATRGARGLLNQADILSAIGPVITVRGDTFVVRAYGESKNALMGNTSKAYCEAVVQRTAEPVRSGDDKIAPESEFGRKFKIVSFKWLTDKEL